MYCIAVSEMTIDTMTAKKVARLPFAIMKTRITKSEPMIAETMFMASGVPCLAELAQPQRRGAVEPGHGLDAGGALLPHAAGADDRER